VTLSKDDADWTAVGSRMLPRYLWMELKLMNHWCAKPARKDCVRGNRMLVAVLVTRNALAKMLYPRWMLRCWVLMWVCPEKEDLANPKLP